MFDRLKTWAIRLWMTSGALRLIQAVIDNDVRGILTLGYRPVSLAARILEVPHALATLAAIMLSGLLMLAWVGRKASVA